MQVSASLKRLRISPRKVRGVSDILKGLDAVAAKHQLNYFAKKSSAPLSKLLDSAMSNAHNNFGLVKDNLYIKDIIVNEGAKLKRFRPKGFGMTSPIEKKTSHIRIILEEKVPGLKAPKSAPREEHPVAEEGREKEAGAEKKQIKSEAKEIKKELGKRGGLFGKIGKRFFRRKAI